MSYWKKARPEWLTEEALLDGLQGILSGGQFWSTINGGSVGPVDIIWDYQQDALTTPEDPDGIRVWGEGGPPYVFFTGELGDGRTEHAMWNETRRLLGEWEITARPTRVKRS